MRRKSYEATKELVLIIRMRQLEVPGGVMRKAHLRNVITIGHVESKRSSGKSASNLLSNDGTRKKSGVANVQNLRRVAKDYRFMRDRITHLLKIQAIKEGR